MASDSIIYTPRGAADEYARNRNYPDEAPLACNLGTGCTFGCKYCYAPDVLRIPRKQFHAAWKPKENALRRFEKDCKKLQARNNHAPIFLSFTHDPCMSPDAARYTQGAIAIAHEHGQHVNVLTKAYGPRVRLTVDMLKPGDIFSVTLTTRTLDDQKEWEPNAPYFVGRIMELEYAHEMGIETRVSFEPVLSPDQTLRLIERVRPFTDLIQVGKLNSPATACANVKALEKSIDWPKFREDAITLLDSLGGEYYIKKDLQDA
jgi:DNA repair photolyase